MNDIEVVIFDIGNVLVEWQPERFFDNQIGSERRRELFAEVDLHGMNLAIDHGAPFEESVRALAGKHPRWADEIMLWQTGWSQMFGPVIARNVALLHDLRAQNILVFALSNFGRETFDVACVTYPFLKDFDRTYISGHLGVLKPEADIYAIVERESGIAPERMFFIDDKPENISAAAARGWVGHVFDSPDALLSDLSQRGIHERPT